MRLADLAGRAKQLIDRRGGTESLKEDAEELRSIARGEGSLGDKAKRAAEAVKEPGADSPARPDPAVAHDPTAGPAHAEDEGASRPSAKGSGPSETARRRRRRERRAQRNR